LDVFLASKQILWKQSEDNKGTERLPSSTGLC